MRNLTFGLVGWFPLMPIRFWMSMKVLELNCALQIGYSHMESIVYQECLVLQKGFGFEARINFSTVTSSLLRTTNVPQDRQERANQQRGTTPEHPQ